MGVYTLGDDDVQLGLSLGKRISGGLKKLSSPVVKAVLRAAPIASFIPGVNVVAAPLAIAKKGLDVKNALKRKPAAKPAGSATVQVQRQLSLQTNRPKTRTAALRRMTTAAPALKKVEPGSASAVAVVQRELQSVKKKATIAQRVRDKVAQLRGKQRQFSDTARRAAQNAQLLQKRAESAAEAGDKVGATQLATQARQVAQVAQVAAAAAQDVASTADRAGAATSAATTAAIAAGATGSEGVGVLTAGVFGFVKENPMIAAAVLAGAGYVVYRATSGGRRRRAA
jgi:hypothetical protein